METIWSSTSRGISLTTDDGRIEVVLPKGSVWRLGGDGRGTTVVCQSGTVWITQEGDLEDYVLSAAERFTLNRQGRSLVMALQESRVVVCRGPL